MIRHTGGTAVAATSTRSRLRWLAISNARARGMTFCAPSTSIKRTSRARICWLMRTLGAGIGLEIGHLLWLRHGWLGFGENTSRELFDRRESELLAAARSRSDLSLGRFAIADDEHIGDLFELRVADLVAELFV